MDRILDEATQVELPLALARDGTAEEIYEVIAVAIDEAQAPVYGSEMPHNYVVIKIVK